MGTENLGQRGKNIKQEWNKTGYKREHEGSLGVKEPNHSLSLYWNTPNALISPKLPIFERKSITR